MTHLEVGIKCYIISNSGLQYATIPAINVLSLSNAVEMFIKTPSRNHKTQYK
jgi:hypothetical protein